MIEYTPRDVQFRLFNGQMVAAQAWGNPDNPLIFAMHGWLDNLASFERLAPYFVEQGYYWVAIDLPGHGLSDPAPSGYLHLLDAVGLVVNVLDEINAQQPILLGHSLGAAIACIVAGTCPQRVKALCLIDALGPYTLRPAQTAVHVHKVISDYQHLRQKKSPSYASPEDAMKARKRVSTISDEGLRCLVSRGLRPDADRWVWRTDQRLTVPPISMLSEEQLESFLRDIQAPACLIKPDKGWPFGEDLFQSRSACFSKLTVHTMSGYHHIHLDEPEAVAKRLLDFLNIPSNRA